jgi:N-acetylneuraminic acid mutarotase
MGIIRKITILFFCVTFFLRVSAQHVYPSPITWKQSGELPVQPNGLHQMGLSGVVSGVVANQIIIAGGNNFPEGLPWEGGVKKYYDQVFVYDVKGDTLIMADSSVRLPSKVAYAAVTGLHDGIFYAGGENEKGPLPNVYLIQKNSNNGAVIISWPDLPEALTNAVAVATSNAVYVLGGATKNGVSDNVWAIYLNDIKAGWKHVSSMPQPTAFAAAVFAQGQVYIMGGRNKGADGISEIYNQTFAWNIANNSWSKKAPLPYVVSAATAVALPDKILFIGGDKGVVFHEVEMLASKIAKTNDLVVKNNLTEIKNKLQQTHPGFSKDVLTYDPILNKWSPYAQLGFTAPVTTNAFLFNHKIILPAGEVKPGVRTPLIQLGTINK